jgi:hypothetical protein
MHAYSCFFLGFEANQKGNFTEFFRGVNDSVDTIDVIFEVIT